MRDRAVVIVVASVVAAGFLACAGGGARKAAQPVTAKPPASSAPAAAPADGVIHVGKAPLRDCPPGLFAKLAPGWQDLDSEETPRLGQCLRGNLLGPSILVYASAPPPADSQSEDPWPARRVIVDLSGRILLEGPPSGGSWLAGSASLDALVDLDGDGVHEIIEEDAADVTVSIYRIYRLAGSAFVEVGKLISSSDDDNPCRASWTVGPPDKKGKRALIVAAQGEMERSSGDDMPDCLDPGIHRFHLDNGQLVEDAAPDGEDGAGSDGDR